MRVSQISVFSQPKNYVVQKKHTCCPKPCPETPQTINPNFKGKFGAWLGAIAGGAAVIATAIVAAPAVACLAGGGALIGGLGLDAVEDAINGEDKDD